MIYPLKALPTFAVHLPTPPLPSAAAIVNKTIAFVDTHFKACSGAILCAQGSWETVAAKRSSSQKEYYRFHSGLLIGSGISSLVESLDCWKAIDLGTLLKTVQNTTSALFLFANFVALEENINTFEQLRSLEDPEMVWKRQAALAGILSNLGYIMTAAVAMFGFSTAVVILLGAISAFFGGVKMLCDIAGGS